MNFIVFFSSHVSRNNDRGIHYELYKCGAWTPLSDSTYAIKTEMSARDLRERLEKALNLEGQVHVAAIPRAYTGPAPAIVREWVGDEANLKDKQTRSGKDIGNSRESL